MLSVTTPLQIKNNPANNSTSKHQWSFSRSDRFKKPKSYCNNSAYDMNTTLSKRRASIGFGERTKYFEGTKGVPQGGKYEQRSEFQNRGNKNKGHSFTANRQNLLFSHFQKTFQNTPAPIYDGDSNQVKKKRAYSLRPKTAYPSNYFLLNQNEKQRKQTLPGPGKYETIDDIGNVYRTKSPNAGVRSFHGRQRFSKGKITPGPSDYQNKTIEPDGIYFLSTMKGSGKRAILNGRRDLKMEGNKQTPGPGTYRANSDFGHYQKPIRPSTARK